MRRTLAGFLLGIAFSCASLAISGFLLQRAAFDPDRTAESADAVLQDDAIRTQVLDLIANATAERLGIPAQIVRDRADALTRTPEGAAVLAEVLHDAHAHLIGEQSGPVQITGQQMVQVVRDESVSGLEPLTLPVPKLAVLDITRTVLRWLVPGCAVAALALLLLGFTAHPERAALLRSLGFSLLLLAVLVATLGYLVPRFAIPALTANPWANAPARLADDSKALIIGMVLVLGGIGVGLLTSSGVIRRRRRWSTPVSTYRYAEERRWS